MALNPSGNEAIYFLAQEAERRATVRKEVERAAAAARERKRVAEALGSDEELAERIRALGFDGDSALALDLLPLIHVAWADGKIQRGERATIFSILEQRGVGQGHPAMILVAALLEKKPSDEYFAESLEVLDAINKDKHADDDIVALCVQVADAAGGLLGLTSRISGAEKELIRKVADALGPDAQAAFKARLG